MPRPGVEKSGGAMDRRRPGGSRPGRAASGGKPRLLASSATAVVLVVAVMALIVYSTVSGKRPRLPTGPPASLGAGASVASARLPGAGLYQWLAIARGRLVLSGGPAGSPLALTPAPTVRGRCRSALVSPRTLALSRRMTGTCLDPRLFSSGVLPIEHVVPGVLNGSTLRVARAGPRGMPTTGPVLLRYTYLSATKPEVVYGGGYMWVYAPLAAAGGVLLAISQTTGLVTSRVRVPEVSGPLLLANATGLWFVAQASLGPTFQPGLYHVTPGSGRPALVVRTTGAQWLAGWQRTVWLGTATNKGTKVVQITGDRVSRQSDLRPAPGSPLLGPEAPAGTASYAGAPGGRVWGVSSGPCARSVLEIDPADGIYRAVASVPAPPGCSAAHARPVGAPLAVLGRYVFLLQAWARGRFGAIYRVGPAG